MPTFIGIASSYVAGAESLTYSSSSSIAATASAATSSFVVRAPNGTWLVGSRAADGSRQVQTSAGGASWTAQLVVGSANGIADAAIRPSDGLCVIPGFGRFYTSTDYSAWTEQVVTGYETVSFNSVVWTGSAFRAIGSDWNIYGSSDGSSGSWSLVGSTGLSGMFITARLRYGNGVLLVGTSGGFIARSTNDGSSFSTGGTRWFGSSAETVYGLTYDTATGTWVAVGTNGKIYVSTDDGLTWAARTSGTTNLLRGVAKIGGKWVVVGHAGTVLDSADTLDWQVSTTQFGASNVLAIGGDGDEIVMYANTPEIGYASLVASDPVIFTTPKFGTATAKTTYLAASTAPQTKFGTPKREIPHYAFVPFGPVEFGTPQLGFTDMAGDASGFIPSRFGTPNLSALSESFTGIHAPRSFNPVTFGTPLSPTEETHVSSGELLPRFGRAKVQPTHYASGFSVPSFGKPKVQSDSIHAAGAMSASRFGKPSVRSFVAKGFDSVRFGTPTAPIANAKGFSASKFGSPKAIYVSQPAYGFQIARFGQPRAVENLYPTDSIELGNFGTPTMYASHVVLHMWPQTQFGQPIIKRAA